MGSDEVEQRARQVLADPAGVHPLLGELTRAERAATAAAVLERLTELDPAVLEHQARRLFRVLASSERSDVRLALARVLPQLTLGRREAARLLFLFDTWLDEPDLEIRRAAMEAMVALLSQCPEQTERVRSEFRRRADAGSPLARSHGLRLLEQVRDF